MKEKLNPQEWRNDLIPPLEEIKWIVQPHALMQGVSESEIKTTHSQINRSSGEGDGSWSTEWIRRAEKYEEKKEHLNAFMRYNIARFPFIQSQIRQTAFDGCLRTFKQWADDQKPEIERKELSLNNGTKVPIYITNSRETRGPMFIVMGGVVSIKEQWNGILQAANKIECPVAVADFPGTGENPLSYHPDSEKDMIELLNKILELVPRQECIIFSSSFSGTFFLKSALSDPRVLHILVNGTPVHNFFIDENWWNQVWTTTKMATASATRLSLNDLELHKKEFAIPHEVLGKFQRPLTYIANLKDEIIPSSEFDLIEQKVRNAYVLKVDDVHGSPNKMNVLRIEMMWHLCQAYKPQKKVIQRIIGLLRWIQKRQHMS